MEPASTYPLNLSVDYPDRDLNRLTTAFRVIVAIPILVVIGSVAGESWSWQSAGGGRGAAAGAGGLLFFGPLLMIVFRQKYPRWWFDWNLELLRFIDRVGVYMLLMDDRYPSTDEHQSVNLDIAYPEVRTELNRWLPLVKWLLAIPHYIVLFFLGHRGVLRGRVRVVRDALHRPLPARGCSSSSRASSAGTTASPATR